MYLELYNSIICAQPDTITGNFACNAKCPGVHWKEDKCMWSFNKNDFKSQIKT